MKKIRLFIVLALLSLLSHAQQSKIRTVNTEQKYQKYMEMYDEVDDCSVRAYSETFDISYRESLNILKDAGRVKGKPMNFKLLMKDLKSRYKERIVQIQIVRPGMRADTFMKEIAEDGFKYMMLYRGHICVIEQGNKKGKTNDWFIKGNSGDRSREIFAYIKIS